MCWYMHFYFGKSRKCFENFVEKKNMVPVKTGKIEVDQYIVLKFMYLWKLVYGVAVPVEKEGKNVRKARVNIWK